MTDHAVLIAAIELLPSLKSRLGQDVRDLLTFTDAEALRALEAITARRPSIVLLERAFAATPRGAALINRIKADPSLAETEIRVVSNDSGASTESAAAAAAAAAAATISIIEDETAEGAPQEPPELDYRGTRRAPRYRVTDPTDILVDGNRGTLIDLSAAGGQLLTASILKPNQRVRVSLTDEAGTVRCAATVVWASFEIPRGAGPRYRAGLEFFNPDISAIEAFIRRHKQD